MLLGSTRLTPMWGRDIVGREVPRDVSRRPLGKGPWACPIGPKGRLPFVGRHWETFGSRPCLRQCRETFGTRRSLRKCHETFGTRRYPRRCRETFDTHNALGNVRRNFAPGRLLEMRETFGNRSYVGRQMTPRIKPPSKKFGVANFIKHTAGNIAAMVIEEVNHVENKGGWYIDTGATAHVCADRSKFYTYKAVEGRKLNMRNQASSEVVGVGDVVLKMTSDVTITLKEELHVPDIHKNLLSGSILVNMNFKLVFESDKFFVYKFGKSIRKYYVTDGLFK